MNLNRKFADVLALRGRIVLFTANAAVGLRFERQAEWNHAQVVTTRSWADAYGPLGMWQRIHAARDYGVLSCDQVRYVKGFALPCTDLVWVGPTEPDHVKVRFEQAMSRAEDNPNIRCWVIQEDAL
jgi:hypothetical protein